MRSLLLALVAVLLLAAATAEEEQHTGGRCPEIPSMRWTYSNAASWSDCPSWSLCSGSTVPQSPMDIVTNDGAASLLSTPFVESYGSYVTGNISNTGHSLQVDLYIKNNTISGGPLGNNVYALKQFHWHSPSEHTLNGVQPVLELHAVHINVANDSDIVVVATMYNLTTNDTQVHAFLKIIASTLPAEPKNTTQTTWEAFWASSGFNAAGDKFEDGDYFYMYRGSLTTPPCAPVTFIISPYFEYVSQSVLDFIKAQVLESNNRPIQANQGRVPAKYSTKVITYSSSTGVNGANKASLSSLPFFGLVIAAIAALLADF